MFFLFIFINNNLSFNIILLFLIRCFSSLCSVIQILPSVSAGQNLFFIFFARTQFGIGDHERWRPGNASGEEWIEKRSSGRHICGVRRHRRRVHTSGPCFACFWFFWFSFLLHFFCLLANIHFFVISYAQRAP